jgi:hypothetical protein
VQATVKKLTKLVEGHRQLHSKVEQGVLVLDVCNKLEPEDSVAAIRKTRMKIHAPSTNCQMMSSSSYLDILVKGSTVLLHALI